MKSLVKVACAALMMALTCTQAHAEHEIVAGGPREANAYFGYSSKQEKFKGQCMTGDLVEIGQPRANVSYSQNMTQSEMQRELGMETSGRFSYGAVSGSMSAKFLHASTSNAYSLSATYSGDYRFPNLYLQNPTLSSIGNKVVKSPDRFENTCGDEYVSQIQRGAKLFFTIRIDFSSEEDKTIFESSFAFNSSMVEAKSKLNAMAKNKNQHASVTVAVYQMGGNVAKLTGIFKGTSTSSTGDEAIGFVKCTLGDFSQCDGVLGRAIEYATDTTGGFPSQLTKDNVAPLVYETVPYEQAGLYVKYAPGVDQAVKSAQEDLSRLFERHLKFHQTATYLLNEGIVLLSPQQREALTKMDAADQDNIARLVKAADVCYDDPRNCTQTLADMNPEKKGGLAKIDESILEIHPESFVQFCAAAGSPAASQELKQTIAALITRAKEIDKSRFYDKDPADCTSAHMVFIAQEKLDLKGLGIRTAGPLQEFTQLRELDLSNNQIEDAAPLGKLTGLTKLNLKHNSVRGIEDFSTLVKLKEVDLSDNVIRNTDTLAKLASIERIDLRGNLPGTSCPSKASVLSCFIKPPKYNAQVLKLGSLNSSFGTASVNDIGNGEFLLVGDKTGTFDVRDQKFNPIAAGGFLFQITVAIDNDNILIVGKDDNRSLWIFNRKSQAMAALPVKLSTSRAGGTATKIKGNKILIAGGFTMTMDKGVLPRFVANATADILDLDHNSIHTINMSAPRAFHTATALDDGRVIVAGGMVQYRGVESIDIFNPVTESFSVSPHPLRTGRGGHSANVLNDGNILFAGGFGKSGDITCVYGAVCPLDTAEIYDTRTGELLPVFDHLKAARGFHTATRLQSGDILFAAGSRSPMPFYGGDNVYGLGSVEVFQAEDESFNLLSTEMSPRANHGVIPVSENTFIYVGGQMKAEANMDMLTLTPNRN